MVARKARRSRGREAVQAIDIAATNAYADTSAVVVAEDRCV
jgi:hypothetical protein